MVSISQCGTIDHLAFEQQEDWFFLEDSTQRSPVQLLLFWNPPIVMASLLDVTLYLVTDSTPTILGNANLFEEAIKGGVTIVQYHADTAVMITTAQNDRSRRLPFRRHPRHPQRPIPCSARSAPAARWAAPSLATSPCTKKTSSSQS